MKYVDASQEIVSWRVCCKSNFTIHETKMTMRMEGWREELDSRKRFHRGLLMQRIRASKPLNIPCKNK